MAALACLIALSIPNEPAQALPWGGTDFVQYYVAWELIFEGKNPYDRALAVSRQKGYGRENLCDTYAPPWALLPSLLVAGLPLPQAIFGFININILLLVCCTLCWYVLLFPINIKSLLFVPLGAFLWFPCWVILGFGQISPWPLLGFTGWLLCTRRRLFFLAGLMLFLTAVKPHLGLMPGVFAGVYAIRQRQWATVLGFGLALLSAVTATIWFRPTIWADYFAALRTGTPPMLFYTATFDGWVRAHFYESFGYVSWTLWLGALVFAANIAWRLPCVGKGRIANASSGDDTSRLEARLLEYDPVIAWSVLICLLTLVCVPYAFHFDYVFMLPGFFVAIAFWLNHQPQGRSVLVIWIMLAVALMFAHPAQWPQDYFWVISWTGLGTTVWLLWRRCVKSKVVCGKTV